MVDAAGLQAANRFLQEMHAGQHSEMEKGKNKYFLSCDGGVTMVPLPVVSHHPTMIHPSKAKGGELWVSVLREPVQMVKRLVVKINPAGHKNYFRVQSINAETFPDGAVSYSLFGQWAI